MNRIFVIIPILFVLMMSQTAFGAGPGTGTCPGNGTGYGYAQGLMNYQQTAQTICSGSTETITGVVTGAWVPGAGLTIETDSGPQTVFGLGPIWYWDAGNIDRPEIGESVSVVASGVTVSDRKVMLSITIDGQSLQLRDPSTCLPVWRGKRAFQGNPDAGAGPAFVQ